MIAMKTNTQASQRAIRGKMFSSEKKRETFAFEYSVDREDQKSTILTWRSLDACVYIQQRLLMWEKGMENAHTHTQKAPRLGELKATRQLIILLP